MRSVLLILGAQTNEFARGDYNRGLFETAIRTLEGHFEAMTTVIEDGYDVAEEIAKFVSADVVIYQYPVFWFMMPPGMKRYIDACTHTTRSSRSTTDLTAAVASCKASG